MRFCPKGITAKCYKNAGVPRAFGAFLALFAPMYRIKRKKIKAAGYTGKDAEAKGKLRLLVSILLLLENRQNYV